MKVGLGESHDSSNWVHVSCSASCHWSSMIERVECFHGIVFSLSWQYNCREFPASFWSRLQIDLQSNGLSSPDLRYDYHLPMQTLMLSSSAIFWYGFLIPFVIWIIYWIPLPHQVCMRVFCKGLKLNILAILHLKLKVSEENFPATFSTAVNFILV